MSLILFNEKYRQYNESQAKISHFLQLANYHQLIFTLHDKHDFIS